MYFTELIVSTFIFHSSPVLLSTLMGWVGHDPLATQRAFYFSLRYHAAYFHHLGSAFVPAADFIFAEICRAFREGSHVFRPVPLEYSHVRSPTVSCPSLAPKAQYLPVDNALSRGGPFFYVHRLSMAFRMARRSIFNISVFKANMVPPKPLSRILLSSLTSLQCLLIRHTHLVEYTRTLSPSFHEAYIPRLLHDPCLLRYFSCLVPSRNVHSPLNSWIHSPTVPPSRTISCIASSRNMHSSNNYRTHSSAVPPSRTTPPGVHRQRLSCTSSNVVPTFPFQYLRISRTLSCVIQFRSSRSTHPRSVHILPCPVLVRALRFLAFLATLLSDPLVPYIICLSSTYALPSFATRYPLRHPLSVFVPLFNEYFSYHPP